MIEYIMKEIELMAMMDSVDSRIAVAKLITEQMYKLNDTKDNHELVGLRA